VNTECDVYRLMFLFHAEHIIQRCEAMTDEQWNWRPSVPAPNARETASHALMWMISDRMHLEERTDVHTAIVEVPNKKEELLQAFRSEVEVWRTWLTNADSRDLNKKVKRFGILPTTKRFFVGHALQNLVYKSGQVSVLYFAQGLDGTEPFKAPSQQEILATLEPFFMNPLIAAVIAEDATCVKSLLNDGANANQRAAYDVTALHLAASYDNQELINLLLAAGADINALDDNGATPIISAASAGCGRAVRLLLWSGADTGIVDKTNRNLLDHAKESGDREIISICELGLQIAK